MEIKEQSGLRAVLQDVEIPNFYVVRQNFVRDGIGDVPAYLQEKLDREDLRARIRPGMKVVLTGSSRQIANMPVILRELAAFVRAQGGEPYIIPAMGSHGGATAEGQREILESYGITEEFCGCPIFSSMETVQVGNMACGDEVRMDRFAYEADAIIVVGRIKGHTAFRGPYESGLIKMMAIGLGKREGADSLHRAGFRVFSLANNHTYDKGAEGIAATLRFWASMPVFRSMMMEGTVCREVRVASGVFSLARPSWMEPVWAPKV